MAVGMLIAGEDVTRESYVALTEKMFGNYPMRDDQSPAGLIIHTAGESPQGFYIYDIWESKEQFQQFAESMLMPAAHELADGGDPPAIAPVFYEIESLVRPV